MTTTCPICGKDDQIQKVTSVVQGGVSSGSFSGPTGGITYSGGHAGYVGGYTTLHGSTSTSLAQLLSAPNEPRKKGSCFSKAGLMFFGLFALIGLFISVFTNDSSSIPTTIVFSVIAIVCLAGMSSNNSWNTQEYPKEVAEWQRKTSVYDTLYYCHRDDIVFDPSNNNYKPPADIKDLLG